MLYRWGLDLLRRWFLCVIWVRKKTRKKKEKWEKKKGRGRVKNSIAEITNLQNIQISTSTLISIRPQVAQRESEPKGSRTLPTCRLPHCHDRQLPWHMPDVAYANPAWWGLTSANNHSDKTWSVQKQAMSMGYQYLQTYAIKLLMLDYKSNKLRCGILLQNFLVHGSQNLSNIIIWAGIVASL